MPSTKFAVKCNFDAIGPRTRRQGWHSRAFVYRSQHQQGGIFMRYSIALLVALGAAPLQAAPPAKGDVGHDIRCFLAVSTLLETQDKDMHEAGLAATNFFAGKIFGTAPDIDLTAAFKREASALTDAGIKTLMGECGREMEARGDQLTQAGNALGAEEAAQDAAAKRK